MNAARTSPSYKDFENSENAFFEILETYKPDLIICWGKRLYNNLPGTDGKEGNYIETEDGNIETWVYKETIKVLPIYHPSTGFDWDYWHKVIKVMLD